jgi:hypothetical protein
MQLNLFSAIPFVCLLIEIILSTNVLYLYTLQIPKKITDSLYLLLGSAPLVLILVPGSNNITTSQYQHYLSVLILVPVIDFSVCTLVLIMSRY